MVYSNDWNKIDLTDERFNFSKEIHFEPKHLIFNEGDAANKLYFVRSGLIKLMTIMPNGKARIVRLCPTNSILGIEGLSEDIYAYSAIAMSASKVSNITLSSVDRLKYADTALYAQLLERFLGEINRVGKWHADISSGSIRARAARLLIYLSSMERGSNENQLCLMCCEDIASILGATVESVSRILADFKRKGFIKQLADGPRGLYRCNMEALLVMASDDKTALEKFEKSLENRHCKRKSSNIEALVYLHGIPVSVASIKNQSENGVFLCFEDDAKIEYKDHVDIKLSQSLSNSSKLSISGRVVHRTTKGVGILLEDS